MSLELNLLPKNQRNILKLMVPSLQRPIQTFLNIDSAKPKSGACIFFSRTSQGHNALPRPGLEPGLSDLEPSALTTGLLDTVPVVQLTTHVKSSTLYGRTVVHSNFFGLMGYYYFV